MVKATKEMRTIVLVLFVVDVWSWALVFSQFFGIVLSRTPYDNISALHAAIWSTGLKIDLIELVVACLAERPKNRPEFAQDGQRPLKIISTIVLGRCDNMICSDWHCDRTDVH